MIALFSQENRFLSLRTRHNDEYRGNHYLRRLLQKGA